MTIQWYPGHMTKSIRRMKELISLVDVVVELLDARIPYSSKNPDIDTLAVNKRRIIVLNKSDLADPHITEKWSAYFRSQLYEVALVNSLSGKGVQQITPIAHNLMAEKIKRQKERGRVFTPIRAMVVGIPNVGKSSFVNRYVGGALTKTGDKPGVTRGQQWVKIKKDFELLDTPGILWPKFDDQNVGLNLAFTGALNDQILDSYTLALKLIECLQKLKPSALTQRYNIQTENKEAWQTMQDICQARGFIMKGGLDTDRGAAILLDEFRGGKLGRISLELPI